jgi:hypothetical protein
VTVDVARWHSRGIRPGTTTGAWWCSRGDHVGTVLTGQEFGWRYIRVENGWSTRTATLWTSKSWLAFTGVVGTAWACCVGKTPV